MRRSGCRPEPREGRTVGGFAKLFERPLADLTNSLARDAHERADLLEGHSLGAFFEAVVQIENLPLARRQVLSEHAVDELAHQLEVSDFFDLGAIDASESLTKGAGFAVGA